MPTIQVDILEATQKQNTITFTAKQGNNIIARTVQVSQFDTWEQFANWLINQEPDFVRLPEKEKSLSIEFHTETVIDPEFGEEEVRVLDNVIVL